MEESVNYANSNSILIGTERSPAHMQGNIMLLSFVKFNWEHQRLSQPTLKICGLEFSPLCSRLHLARNNFLKIYVPHWPFSPQMAKPDS